jgi:hypothetical protein
MPRWLALAAVALGACLYRDNRLYCDEDAPCRDPARPFCDLDGAYPASQGIASTCIPDPFDGTVCSLSAECGAEQTPICDPQMRRCRRCEAGAGGAAECAERSIETPACADDGRCVQCVGPAQCGAALPACGPEQLCGPCSPGAAGDALCAGRGDGNPRCAPVGACVECLGREDCKSPDRPVCAEDGRCRACAGPADCPGGTCDGATGACTTAVRAVH